jgi:hypothetical protein
LSELSNARAPVRPDGKRQPEEDSMRYLMQIYQRDALERQASLQGEERQRVWSDYAAISNTAGVTTGEQLAAPETATTVRVADGQTLTTDGPFAETKEALGGYFILDTDDLDTAIELAARVPAARYGGAVEIRPLVER